jgi:hypothetical protein
MYEYTGAMTLKRPQKGRRVSGAAIVREALS